MNDNIESVPMVRFSLKQVAQAYRMHRNTLRKYCLMGDHGHYREGRGALPRFKITNHQIRRYCGLRPDEPLPGFLAALETEALKPPPKPWTRRPPYVRRYRRHVAWD